MNCQIWSTPSPTWAFIPILCSFRPLINPFIPFSTKKRLMPWAGDRASRLVMATTITRSLNQPLVMNTCKNPNALWCPVIVWSLSKPVLVGWGTHRKTSTGRRGYPICTHRMACSQRRVANSKGSPCNTEAYTFLHYSCDEWQETNRLWL